MGRRTPKKKVMRTISSDKHDILYSKARYVLNQRHIKRPWFNLNPFLEKTDAESIDLENYFPEESKYIQPLESLVLRERYSSEHPVDTREIAVDYFFDYLFSDEWSDGCSVRILEGQLLDELLVCLYRMEREKIAVRHTTYAFAKNKRPRTGCYKLADKGAYGYIHETLLIEFAYFGHLFKKDPNPVTTNPLEYLRTGVTDFIEDSSPLSFSPPLLDGIPRRKRDNYQDILANKGYKLYKGAVRSEGTVCLVKTVFWKSNMWKKGKHASGSKKVVNILNHMSHRINHMAVEELKTE